MAKDQILTGYRYYWENICPRIVLQDMLCFTDIQCVSSWRFWSRWNTDFWPQKPEMGTERRRNNIEDFSAFVTFLKIFFPFPKTCIRDILQIWMILRINPERLCSAKTLQGTTDGLKWDRLKKKKVKCNKITKKLKRFVILRSFVSQGFLKTSSVLICSSFCPPEVCIKFPVQTDIKFKAKLRAAKFLFELCHMLLI